MGRLLTMAEVTEILGISHMTLYRWRKAGRFPEPVRVGPNSVRWPASVVEEWIDARPAA